LVKLFSAEKRACADGENAKEKWQRSELQRIRACLKEFPNSLF
jgi:hypothetical protein